jgi:hypothetical protein
MPRLAPARSFLALALLALGHPAFALTVTSLGDNGPGTLREALIDATNGDTIDFAVTGTIELTTGELAIDKNVSIVGPGVSALAIDGKTNGRVFHASLGSVATISNLSITNGVASGADDGGGCVWNQSSDLTLDRVRIFECSAGYGGAVLNDGEAAPATMRIVDSTIDHNATVNAGAAVYNDGSTSGGDATLVVERSTFERNQVSDNSGGAIYNDGFGQGHAVLSVRAGTFSDNTASDNGGAIANAGYQNGAVTATVVNSTFSGNTADAGSAIHTVATNGGTAATAIGNCLFERGAGETLNNDGGTVTSLGFNLASDAASGDGATGPGGLLNGPNDRRNLDPLLGALQSNGGPTQTHALLPGSPAIDRGKRDTATALADATDQRGIARPIDDSTIANAPGGDGSDIGAFELAPPPDLAVTQLKPPKRIGLKTNGPTVTKTVKVQMQNRSAVALVIPDTATLAALVDVEATALGAGCAAPAPALAAKGNKLPRTIKPKKKLTVAFTVTFACAVDPAKTSKKDPGHDDFRWTATVDHAAIDGIPDAHPDDDACPRPALPGGSDPRPDPKKPIKDRGCGGKLPDKTLGADVTTDVVVK